jgi:hypothetical protein
MLKHIGVPNARQLIFLVGASPKPSGCDGGQETDKDVRNPSDSIKQEPNDAKKEDDMTMVGNAAKCISR